MRAVYSNPAIQQLRDRLMRFAPCDQKIAKADLAEKLLGELDPKQTYSSGFLCARLANAAPVVPATSVTGREARRDLQLFVQELSDAANVPAEKAGEPVLTLGELSQQLNVSTKTISRWKRHGLVSRRFVFDGRKRVGFLQSSVDRFVRRNRQRVQRASKFSQMTDSERDEVIALARQMIAAGQPVSRISGQLANQTGRSVETIRYVLRQFDRENPDRAILGGEGGPLPQRTKREIYHRYRCGESVEAIARRYDRSRTSIYRVIGEIRLERILQLPLEYVPNEQFDRAYGGPEEEEILAPTPAGKAGSRRLRSPGGLPPYLASLYETPLLSREQEAHLFRKMNYAKYKAARLLAEVDPEHPSGAVMDEIERFYETSVAAKNAIIRANLRLVVSIAKRKTSPTQELFDLISDGNMSLIRAVEKFDFARGFKFSTYATWAIVKNFARSIPHEHRLHERFRTSQDEVFLATEELRSDPYAEAIAQAGRAKEVARIMGCLDQREQQVIFHRFGLGGDSQAMTLKEVGNLMGVTKERVRQLEGRAMDKLREAARRQHVEFPETANG